MHDVTTNSRSFFVRERVTLFYTSKTYHNSNCNLFDKRFTVDWMRNLSIIADFYSNAVFTLLTLTCLPPT